MILLKYEPVVVIMCLHLVHFLHLSLFQVDYVDMAQNLVHLKLLPRIDYSRMRGALRTISSDADSRKKKKRPMAKLFDPEKVRSIGGEITNDGDFLVFEGNRYSRKGYLYKVSIFCARSSCSQALTMCFLAL